MKLAIAIMVGLAASSAAPKVVHGEVTELAGRAAGKAQRCIPSEQGRLFTVSTSNSHILLYERGNTIWASRLDASCGFKAGQTVIPDSNAGYYCKGDLVRAGDRITLMPFGELCPLGEFRAYK